MSRWIVRLRCTVTIVVCEYEQIDYEVLSVEEDET